MDRRCLRRPDPPPTPPPNPSFLRDVSNYRTPIPKNPNPNPNPSPIFFTASKETPTSSSLPRRRPSSISHPTAARRLKALELEQSRSARKTQVRKEKTLKSFARSVTAWLNFLLEDPKACGCEVVGEQRASKRQRSSVTEKGTKAASGVERASAVALEASLKDVCSFVDMRERMEGYLSRKGFDEVVLMMSRVCKVGDLSLRFFAEFCLFLTYFSFDCLRKLSFLTAFMNLGYLCAVSITQRNKDTMAHVRHRFCRMLRTLRSLQY
ncbi:abnormal spindle-like microcephaly-associated protein-like protein isoform X1 [Iris pallida]|uniref:Abnormal spindle-like microcephaly-associated protein-like protein isoform X1 n=1 Tax=Iris pallida TaxID=29817 RepID=A0AAX6FIG6_IRIPA|nr:abnormal spindle-like microcephaly-associated protein-like protein isoform X1 [Iris pallida]